jgi:hypothetical protein
MGHPAGNGMGVSRGLKPVFSAGDGIAQAEAWAYLRNKGKGKGQYGDSGCARMTGKNRQPQVLRLRLAQSARQTPLRMTNIS